MNTSFGPDMAKIMASYDGPQKRRELKDILRKLGIGKGKVFVKFGFCELPIDYDSLSGLARVMDSPSNRIDSMWYEETKANNLFYNLHSSEQYAFPFSIQSLQHMK